MGELVTDSLVARDDLLAAGFDNPQAAAVVDIAYRTRKGLATSGDIHALQLDLKGVRWDIRDLRTTTTGLESRVAGLEVVSEKKFEVVEQKLETATRKIEALREHGSAMGAEISGMSAEIRVLSGDVQFLKREMVTKQDAQSQRTADRWIFGMLWAFLLANSAANTAMLFHVMG